VTAAEHRDETLTSNLLAYLKTLDGFSIQFSQRVVNVKRAAGGLWRLDAEDETTGVVLAAHAAAAILASRQGEQLESALSTRDRIGQAKGIIMERFGVDDVQAFEMLRRLSQDSNTRLIEVAKRVIDTRGE